MKTAKRLYFARLENFFVLKGAHFLSSDLLESMRQAELCDWALDPALFTSLCDSLNRFFTQKGMITPGNSSPLALGAPHSLHVPPFTTNPPPTLSSLIHPSPLPYSPIVHPASGAQPPRRALHMQGQGLQRPQLTQPTNSAGKTWTSCSKNGFLLNSPFLV